MTQLKHLILIRATIKPPNPKGYKCEPSSSWQLMTVSATFHHINGVNAGWLNMHIVPAFPVRKLRNIWLEAEAISEIIIKDFLFKMSTFTEGESFNNCMGSIRFFFCCLLLLFFFTCISLTLVATWIERILTQAAVNESTSRLPSKNSSHWTRPHDRVCGFGNISEGIMLMLSLCALHPSSLQAS